MTALTYTEPCIDRVGRGWRRARAAALAGFAALVACGAPEEPTDAPPAAPSPEAASDAPRGTVFQPLTESLDRAQSVEETLREQEERQRRSLEEAESR